MTTRTGELATNEYRCALCGNVYERELTDVEAAIQLEAEFPGMRPEDCVVVCEDCFVAAGFTPSGSPPTQSSSRDSG